MAPERQLRQNGERQLRVLHQSTSPIDLSLDIFITAKEAERCTPRTIETYRFILERFRVWLGTHGVADARQITPHHSAAIGTPIAAHDVRRAYAKLAHKGSGRLDQIQLTLGHASIRATEKYLGITQDLQDAPCDHLGLRLD